MGPTFGRTDIRIDTRLVVDSSSSHLGTSYFAPNEVKDNSTILAGANRFDPDELEVFYLEWLLKRQWEKQRDRTIRPCFFCRADSRDPVFQIHSGGRLDYQPLFGKMSQRPDPGDGGNRAYSGGLEGSSSTLRSCFVCRAVSPKSSVPVPFRRIQRLEFNSSATSRLSGL